MTAHFAFFCVVLPWALICTFAMLTRMDIRIEPPNPWEFPPS